MRDQRSPRGFGSGLAVGVLIGLVLGSASLATASFGYKGWEAFSDEFKVGYVTGFLGMANLARNLEPGGWVDEKYPQFSKAKPTEWVTLVDQLYKKPENQNYSIHSILQTAAHELELKYGKPATADERSRQRMAHQLEAARKAREKAGPPPPEDPEAKAKYQAALAAQLEAQKKQGRKWCRCDGTDPKEARARRQAAATASKSGNATAVTPPAAATKTPPASTKTAEPASK